MANNYYNLEALNFHNSIYALDITIESHFSNLLFGGDATRIIYADTSNAFRKRAKGKDWNNLYLPFMNYKISKIEQPAQNRAWWNNVGNTSGVWSEILQKKIRTTPIIVKYEATVFYHRNDDMQYAMSELIWDDSHETYFRPILTVDVEGTELTETVALNAILGYNLDFEPTYVQKDWFEQNRIHSITLDFEFDYSYIKDNTTGFGIPDQVLFDWGRLHCNDTSSVDEIYKFLIDRVHETVTWESTTKTGEIGHGGSV